MTEDIPEDYVNWEGMVACRECGLVFLCEIPIPRGLTGPDVPIECPECRIHAVYPLPDASRN